MHGVGQERCELAHGLRLHVAVLDLPLVDRFQEPGADQSDD